MRITAKNDNMRIAILIQLRRTPTECEYNINANHCEERSHLIVSAIVMKKKMFDCSLVWLNNSSVHNEETTIFPCKIITNIGKFDHISARLRELNLKRSEQHTQGRHKTYL